MKRENKDSNDRKKDPKLIKIGEGDNVKTVANTGGLEEGTVINNKITTKDHIPQGHKLAIKNFSEGDKIIKYGKVIGYASERITRGSWVHENNMNMPEPPPLSELEFAQNIKSLSPLEKEYSFYAYENNDGSVSVKNVLGIVATVQCVEGVVEIAREKIEEELLPQFKEVDGVTTINHNYGCGVAIEAEDADIPQRTVRNLALNPNIGELLVISLGCEKLYPDRLFENREVNVITLHEKNGFEEMLKSILKSAENSLKMLNKRKRKKQPLSKLSVGLQCGASDAFSGITANPALGHTADLLVRAGATVVFAETTEVRDGIHHLASRVASEELGEKLVSEVSWYDKYLAAQGVDRGANTTPGNKEGGLANIVEKAMGSIEKSGNAPIIDVLSPGEKATKSGLNFAVTPASDFVCGTLQVATGINIQVFATGRGTPYGLSMVPVVKISSRTDLKEKWPDLIDINAGKIADESYTHEEVGKEIFEYIIEVASGKRKPQADHLGIENRLCLFNPAPIT